MDKEIIYNKLKEIQELRKKYEKEIENKRHELFALASSYDNYTDVYLLVKKLTKTDEEFNLAMFEILPNFLKGKKIE